MRKFIIWLFRIKPGDICGSNYCDREHHLERKIAQLEKQLDQCRMHIITHYVIDKETL